jgi:hypothetical protein
MFANGDAFCEASSRAPAGYRHLPLGFDGYRFADVSSAVSLLSPLDKVDSPLLLG